MSSTDHKMDAMDMAIVRRRNADHPWHRRMAVCTFPLVVAQVANDMREILRRAGPQGMTKECEEAVAYMESQIREVYREQFGTELGL